MNSNDKKDESQEPAPLHTKTSQKKLTGENPSKETLEILALVKSLIKSDVQKSKDIADLKSAIQDEQANNSKAQVALKESFNTTLKTAIQDEHLKSAKAQHELKESFNSTLKVAIKDILKSNTDFINKKFEELTSEESDFAKVFSSIEENMNAMNESIINLYQNLDTSDLKTNVETLSEQVSDMLEASADGHKIMSKFKDDAMKSLDKLAGASANLDDKFIGKTEELKVVLEQVTKATATLSRTADDTVRRTNAQLTRSVDESKNNIIDLSKDLHNEIRDTGKTVNESVRINGVNVANNIDVLISDSAKSSQNLRASADKANEVVYELNSSIEKTETLIKKADIKKEELLPMLTTSVKVLKELTDIADGLSISLADDQSSGDAK